MRDDQAHPGSFFTPLLLALVSVQLKIPLQQFADRVSYKGNILQIHTRLWLVKEQQVCILGHQLQEFRALDLTARKACVDVTLQKIGKVHLFRQGFHIHVSFSTDLNHLPCLHSMNRGGPLIRDAYAKLCPFVNRHISYVFSFEDDLSTSHPVLRVTHDRHE